VVQIRSLLPIPRLSLCFKNAFQVAKNSQHYCSPQVWRLLVALGAFLLRPISASAAAHEQVKQETLHQS